MNWRLSGRFVLLEDGAALSNLVASAAGLVFTVEGELRALLPAGVELGDGGAAARWALGELLGSPLRTAGLAAARLYHLLAAAPLPFAAGAWAAWAGRRDPRVAALGALAGYLLAAHAALAVQANWPCPPPRSPPCSAPTPRAACAFGDARSSPRASAAPAAAAAAALACATALALVVRYGLRAPSPSRAPAA